LFPYLYVIVFNKQLCKITFKKINKNGYKILFKSCSSLCIHVYLLQQPQAPKPRSKPIIVRNKSTSKKLLEKKNPIKKYKNLGSLKKKVKIEFPKEQKIQTTLKKNSKK
jgi:hypothetical protein